jgi:hypothetical protein
MGTDAIRTERLAAKFACYTRQRKWDEQDNLSYLITDAEMNALTTKLRKIAPESAKIGRVLMNEHSATNIPGATIHRPHQESGIEPLSIVEEAQRAAREAEKQSTKKVT